MLHKSDKPGLVLANYYCALFEKDRTRSEIIMCNKLVKVFGRSTVFFSILDMNGYHADKEIESPYTLLYTICRKRFEAEHVDSNIQARESLMPYITEVRKEKEKAKKRKVKIPALKGKDSSE